MKSPKKPDPVNVPILDRLSAKQKKLLTSWLTTGGPHGLGIAYRAAVQRVAANFGIKTSVPAMSLFYHRHAKGEPAISLETTRDGQGITIVVHLYVHEWQRTQPKTGRPAEVNE